MTCKESAAIVSRVVSIKYTKKSALYPGSKISVRKLL